MCPAGNQMRRWFGHLKDTISAVSAQFPMWKKQTNKNNNIKRKTNTQTPNQNKPKNPSVTQPISLAQRKRRSRHRQGFVPAKCCWNPTSKGHALCSKWKSYPHYKMCGTIYKQIKYSLITELLPSFSSTVAIWTQTEKYFSEKKTSAATVSE